MTTIERTRFAQDLAAQSLRVGSMPAPVRDVLQRAGITSTELDRIAGADHVIQGQAEYERLYDRLVALEARTPRAGEARIDHARALYDAARAPTAPSSATPATPATPTTPAGPPDDGAARGRSTGIFTPRASLVPSLLDRARTLGLAERAALVPSSDHVRAFGAAAEHRLDDAARRNSTGPEADAQRRIRALTERTVERVRGLEARASQLPRGSAARRELEATIDAEVERFERQVGTEQAQLAYRRGGEGGSATDALVRNLPPYLRESVRREGVVIPGVPGAVAPRFGGTPGFDWKVKF